jgi:hypothetical protein
MSHTHNTSTLLKESAKGSLEYIIRLKPLTVVKLFWGFLT